jgi:hypothetical protein
VNRLPLTEMLSAEKIKETLYLSIKEVGQEKIKKEINSNIRSSRKYFELLLNKSIRALVAYEGKPHYSTKAIVILGEALLHYMLTVSALPSQRKIQVNGELVIDVIIPSLRFLKSNPHKSIIIQFIKEKRQLDKISKLKFFQPNSENIWLISAKPISMTKYKTYSLLPNSYSHIIIDINNFLKKTGDRSFRLIP